MNISPASCRGFFLVFLFCFGIASYAQSISGIVKDKNTKMAIPYATVSIGTDYGVVTNDAGEFQINTENLNPNDSLSFSSMGYEKLQLAIKDFVSGAVFLQEDVNQLDEVYIVNKNLDLEDLMEKVNENLAKNYDYDYQKFTVFKRTKSVTKPQDYGFKIKKADFIPKKTQRIFNKSVDSLSKANKGSTSTFFDDSLAEVYVGAEDSLKLNLIKFTELINEENNKSVETLTEDIFKLIIDKLRSPYTYKVRTGIIPVEDSLDLSIEQNEKEEFLVEPEDMRYSYSAILRRLNLCKKDDFKFITKPNRYDYKLEKVTNFNDEMVYVLSFEPDGWFGGEYTGELYISAETYAVLKADYRLVEGEKASAVNLKFLLGVKYYEDQDSGTIVFQKNKENKYLPKFVKTHSRRYVYFDRSFVFKENNPDRDKRAKLKFNILMESITTIDTEILFADNNKVSEQDFEVFEESKKTPIEKIKKYDPKIWKDYNIIAPTKAIKEFEFSD